MYLPKILPFVMINDATVHKRMIPFLDVIYQQGFVHPIIMIPSIIALSSSFNKDISFIATQLFRRIVEKHSSFSFNVPMENIRKAFELHNRTSLGNAYEASATPDGAQFFTCCLNNYYNVLQEKKKPKYEFLNALLSVYDASSDMNCGDFETFVSQIVATLPYKTNDEVLYVLHALNRFVSLQDESKISGIPLVCVAIQVINYLYVAYDINSAKMESFKPNEKGKNEKALSRAVILTKDPSVNHLNELDVKTRKDKVSDF
jgi:hypothetical protein